jgi:hypothetical protein
MTPLKTSLHGTARAIVAAAALALLLSACGLTAPRSNDGFANLDSPGMTDTDRVMALSFGPTVLRFAARFVDDEPETKALLKSLDGVRVRIYEVTGDNGHIVDNFREMGAKLDQDGWDPVMLVREENELVQMYSKAGKDGILGLTIFSADAHEVVVVNIMGDINPRYYGDVMVALNVEGAPEVEVANVN